MNENKNENRFLAFFTDMLMAGIVAVPLLIPVLFYGLENTLSYRLIILSLLYTLILCKDIYYKGQGLGKHKFGMMVVSNNGKEASYLQLILRNITFFIWPLDIIVYCINKDGKRLGDIIAGTKVVSGKRNAKISRVKCCCIIIFMTVGFSLLLHSIINVLIGVGCFGIDAPPVGEVVFNTSVGDEVRCAFKFRCDAQPK